MRVLVVVSVFAVAFCVAWRLLFGAWPSRTPPPAPGTPTPAPSAPRVESTPRSAPVPPTGVTAPVPLTKTVPERSLPPELQDVFRGRNVSPRWVSYPEGASFWVVPVTNENAHGEWQRLHDAHPVTGWYPVLLGEEVPAEDYYGAPLTPEELTEALERDVQDVLFPDEDPEVVWNTGEQHHRDNGKDFPPYDLPFQEGYLALVQARHGWEVPARLGWWGAANYDISPGDHALVLRHWEAAHDTELVHLGEDTLGLLVHRPPQDPRAARQAALESHQYCPDIIEQGPGSLPALARSLPRLTYWGFWWD